MAKPIHQYFYLFLCGHVFASYHPNQPVIIGDHSSLQIISAKDRSISLMSLENHITVNNKDLNYVLNVAENTFYKLKTSKDYIDEIILPKLKEIQDKYEVHKEKLRTFKELFGSPLNNTSLVYATRIIAKTYNDSIQQLKDTVTKLEKKYNQLIFTLTKDDCKTSPCKNGGTCLNSLSGVFCLCPDNWEGDFCEDDVNECEKLRGTNLGCQNGATCINLQGSYKCNCSDGFFGVTCLKKNYTCTKENSAALCGHGFCYNQGGNGTGFVCKCDQGWGKNSTKESDPCTEDIDECALASPCSQNPFVACENTLGGYKCQSCPTGYSGNGHQCADINECEINNGGCSINPKVECVNLRGTSMCHACPYGYSGDGKTCTLIPNLCLINNGGCNQEAVCMYNAGMNKALCRCPFGYLGDGKGPNGCMKKLPLIDGCYFKPCQNGGSCVPASENDDYTCFCLPEFTGKNCSETHDSCSTNPCLNGGICEILKERNSFQCHCVPGFSGHHCQYEENDCVETFTTSNGSLRRKLTYSHKISQKLCRWSIKTEIGKILIIKFLMLKYPERCRDRNDPVVKIFDGIVLAHQYCGSTLPEPFTSSNNVVVIEAGGFLTEDVDFSLTWTTAETRCGDQYLNATGEGALLKSPGYPGLYQKNLKCLWIINAELGKRIKFMVYTLDIKSDEGCNQDHLQFTEEMTQAVIAKLCNSNIPDQIVTSGHKASVFFYTDMVNEGKGFNMFYQQIDGGINKVSVEIDPQGDIAFTSANIEKMPNFYFVWIFEMPEDIKIVIEFKKFSIANCSSSKPENLEVYDGTDTNAPLIGRWCGSMSIPLFKSSTNTLRIIFKGKNLNNNSNFLIHYSTVCERVLKEPNGTIQFYNFQFYYFLKRCYITIQSPRDYHIILNVTMRMKKNVNVFRYPVQIYDGSSTEFPVLETFVNNNFTTKVIKSSFNNLLIEYWLYDFRQINPIISYTTVPLGCGYITTELTGVIKLEKQIPKSCLFIIIAPSNYVIRLSPTYEDYKWDKTKYLTIFQDIPSNTDIKGKKYFEEIPMMMSHSNKISIQSSPFMLFRIDYEALPVNSICHKTLISSLGSIVSPNYPKNYPDGFECVWVIDVATDKRIRLIINDFALENSESCAKDYLEIRNGGTSSSPLIGRYCSKQYPKEIHSHANIIYLKFKTNQAVTGKGFKLTWDVFLSDCGGNVQSSSGLIEVLPTSKYCKWEITTSKGNIIQLTVKGSVLSCKHSFVLHDSKGAKQVVRVCDLEKLDINDNNVVIEYYSELDPLPSSLQIIYQTVCNQTISGVLFGTIESPNFPSSYGIDEVCTWIIEAPIGNTIKMKVSHFTMEFKTKDLNNCSQNYLEIGEGIGGNQPTGVLLKRHCSGNNIPWINSNVNRVFVTFVTSSDVEKSAFLLEWVVSGCSGVFKNKVSGELASPGYPQVYNKLVVCEWLISVPLYQTIYFIIDDMNLDNYKNCTHDYLKIYGGKNDLAPLVSNVCHSQIQSPITVSSLNNYAFVRFNGTAVNRFKGFHATFKTMDSCMTTFSAHSGSFHSLNYPNGYENKSLCVYLISTRETLRINLTFTSLNVDITNCTMSFIEIINTNNYFGRFCEDNKPPMNIVSNGNEMTIIYSAQKIEPKQGFVASYSTMCGGKIVAYVKGTIQSRIANPVDLKSDSTCFWTIFSGFKFNKIILTFTTLYLQTSSTEMTYINIYAGDRNTSAQLVKTLRNNEIPPPIILSTNEATIEFKEEHYAYFTMDYSFFDAVCGGNITSDSGQIVSPNFPNNYPSDIECEWTINLSPGNELTYQFSMIQFEKPDCNEDYIEIRENDRYGKLLGLFCNNTRPGSFHTKTSVWIMFKSAENENGNGKGFQMDYILSNEIILSGSSGEIASPHYPNFYSSSKTFTWKIIVDDNSIIHFEIKNFNLLLNPDDDQSEYCLKFYNGFSTNDPILKVVCKGEPQFISTTAVVFVVIKPQKLRFFLSWQQLDKKSNSKLAKNGMNACNTSVYLTSENSTYQFGNLNMDVPLCEWTFETDPQNHIAIQFTSLKLTGTTNFCYAFIKIYKMDEDVGKKKVATVCYESDEASIHVGAVVKVIYHVKPFVVIMPIKVGFSAKATMECGGSLTRPQGIISYSKIASASIVQFHKHAAICQWNITVNHGSRIEMHFKKSEFPDPEHSCSKSHVVIRNGGYPDSPLLGQGKYCGTVEVPKTSSNRAYIILKIFDDDDLEMELTYKAVPHHCGNDNVLLTEENSEIKEVEISSPNYPNVPPSHTECKWIVHADIGKRISFHLKEKINMAYDKNCLFEYLELRDGSSELGHLIGRYCSELPFSTIQTEGNALFIKYFTGIDNPNDGFIASISLSSCGGTIFTKSYKIVSTELNTINRNKFCIWRVRVEPGESYDLLITGLKKSYYNPPKQPLLTLWDEKNLFSSLNFYQSDNNSTFQKEVGRTEITYTIPEGKVPYFSIELKKLEKRCGGHIHLSSGSIASPIYSLHKSNIYCEWKIEGPFGKKVKLTFTDFHLPPNSPDESSVTIQHSNGEIITVLNGLNNSTTVESTSNIMIIIYNCQNCKNYRGFRATYTTFQPSSCSKNLEGATGAVESQLPSIVPSFECLWLISKNSSAETLVLSFNYTIKPEYVENKRIEIIIQSGTKVLAHYDYTFVKLPDTVLIPYKEAKISVFGLYKENESFEDVKLRISWRVNKCGGVSDNHYNLDSSSLPNAQLYPLDCVWVFQHYFLPVKVFLNELFFKGNCADNYLEIRNGETPLAVSIGKYCEKQNPHSLGTIVDYTWIHFHTSEEKHIQKFNLTFLQSNNYCGGLEDGEEGTIFSPFYPYSYDSDTECEWIIFVKPGYHIDIDFANDFQLEYSISCKNDFLELFDFVQSEWISKGRYCGRNGGLQISSLTEKLKILFRSNEKLSGRGFQLNWKMSCGGLLYAQPDVRYITSPGYPNNYFKNLTCNYTIISYGSYIKAHFKAFLLEDKNFISCIDYVKITINLLDKKTLDKYCGNDIPSDFIAKDVFSVIFKTDSYNEFSGFFLEYYMYDCGGNMSSPKSLTFTSQVKCDWNIIAPNQTTIIIRISAIGLSVSADCSTEYIKIWEGEMSSKNKTNLATLCGDVKSQIFKVKKDEAVIELYKYTQNSTVGIDVIFVEAETNACGGPMALGKSFTLTIDTKLPLLCNWYITAPMGTFILIKYMNFSISDHAECPLSIEVYDNLNKNEKPLITTCSSIYNTTIESIIKVTLQAKPKTKATFYSHVTSFHGLCGDTLLNITDQPAILTSPNYPEAYPTKLFCTWRLITESKLIQIHINKVDIENSTFCQVEGLYIEDVGYSNTMTNSILSYCGFVSDVYYYSSTPIVEITFKSNSEVTKSGFNITIQSKLCKDNYTSPQGRIHMVYDSCNIEIHTPPKTFISIYFREMNLPPGDCSVSSITVLSGKKLTELKKNCGKNDTKPIFSSDNFVVIQTKINQSAIQPLFDLSYTSTDKEQGCGGRLVGEVGAFTSPFYPGNIKNSTCEWLIEVPDKLVPLITFKAFGLDIVSCSSYLQLFDIIDEQKVPRVKYCGDDEPADFTGNSNQVLFVYVTTYTYGGIGFSVTFKSVEPPLKEEADSDFLYDILNL